MEFMKYNFMGNKADENVPDQDLSNTTGSSFDDVKTETEESDTQDNSSSVYSDDTSTDTEQNNHNGSVVNEQDGHNGPIVSDIDGLYTYGQLAKLLNKPENNLRYLINTFRDFIHPVAVTTSANAKRANFKYSESDYATLKQILAYKEKGIQNAEIMKLLENGPADDNNDNEDDQIAIIADQRKFVSALIVPVYGYVKEYAKEKGIEYKDMAELLQHPKIVGLFRARIETLQQQFAHYEQIKRFTLLPEPFSMERGELTNTLKLKRAVVAQNYSELIEKMYEE